MVPSLDDDAYDDDNHPTADAAHPSTAQHPSTANGGPGAVGGDSSAQSHPLGERGGSGGGHNSGHNDGSSSSDDGGGDGGGGGHGRSSALPLPPVAVAATHPAGKSKPHAQPGAAGKQQARQLSSAESPQPDGRPVAYDSDDEF
jgi:hypothetical protein